MRFSKRFGALQFNFVPIVETSFNENSIFKKCINIELKMITLSVAWYFVRRVQYCSVRDDHIMSTVIVVYDSVT